MLMKMQLFAVPGASLGVADASEGSVIAAAPAAAAVRNSRRVGTVMGHPGMLACPTS
jgi:hypothetical protein